MPTTIGGPLRTVTSFSGSSADSSTSANKPAHALHRAQHRVLEAVVLPFLLDQVRDDFGVGLGLELVPFGDQLALDLEVVLDDAVVHDDDAAGAVAVRMGVLLGRTAVRGPARVAEAVDARERLAPGSRSRG